MSLHTLPQSNSKPTNADDRRSRQYSLPISNPRLAGDENSEEVASGTIATIPLAVAGEASTADQRGVDSNNPDYQPDMQPCPRGCGPLEYCHRHSPLPLTPSPLPIQPRPLPAQRVVNVNFNRAEATALVDRLSSIIQEDDKNTAALLLPYSSQRVGVQGRPSQGVDTNTTVTTIHIPCPHNEQPTRTASPTPPGFEHNQGAAFIPFNITNQQGHEVPAQYIQVHMSADDPYVLAHATLTGPIYGGQLHAMPVNDTDQPVEPLTDVAMRMFTTNFPGRQHVDAAIASINN